LTDQKDPVDDMHVTALRANFERSHSLTLNNGRLRVYFTDRPGEPATRLAWSSAETEAMEKENEAMRVWHRLTKIADTADKRGSLKTTVPGVGLVEPLRARTTTLV